MTVVVPTALSGLFVLLSLWSRNQPTDRLRRAVKDDPEVGRSLVRSARGVTGRIIAVFFLLGLLGAGASLLIAGNPAGLVWLLAAVSWLWSRAESRMLAERVGELLRDRYEPTLQDRLRDRFSAGWTAVALASLTAARVLGFEGESPWRPAAAGVLLAVTFAAGIAALWSQAWEFSERRWCREG